MIDLVLSYLQYTYYLQFQLKKIDQYRNLLYMVKVFLKHGSIHYSNHEHFDVKNSAQLLAIHHYYVRQ